MTTITNLNLNQLPQSKQSTQKFSKNFISNLQPQPHAKEIASSTTLYNAIASLNQY